MPAKKLLGVCCALLLGPFVCAQPPPAIAQPSTQTAKLELSLVQALKSAEAKAPNSTEVAQIRVELGSLYLGEARYSEAEAVLARAIAILDKPVSDFQVSVLEGALIRMSATLWSMGRFGEAQAVAERGLALAENEEGAQRQTTQSLLTIVGSMQLEQGRYSEAEPLLLRAVALGEPRTLMPDARARALYWLGSLYLVQGRYAEAEPLCRQAVATANQVKIDVPHNVPSLILARECLARALEGEQEFEEARAAYQQNWQPVYSLVGYYAKFSDEPVMSAKRLFDPYFAGYAATLAAIMRDPKLAAHTAPVPTEAFLVAEEAHYAPAQRMLTDAALRAAASDPALTELVRRAQDLRARQQHTAAQYRFTGPEAKAAPTQDATEMEASSAELAEANVRIARVLPKYSELTAPEPIGVAEVQKALHPDQALIEYFTLDHRILAWCIRPERPTEYRDQPIERADLVAMVAQLRASLKPDRPFDVDDSFKLYRLLWSPFETELVGANDVIVVPDNETLPVPFAALITSDQGEPFATLAGRYQQGVSPSPEELARVYPKLAWLANQKVSMSMLPAATSLRLLRLQGSSPVSVASKSEPFIGVGDPLLEGKGATRGGPMVPRRGADALASIRELPRLPGTRDELLADAHALGADPSSVLFMEDRATKPEVMVLNQDRLGRAAVIAFATHALIGGEMVGLREPALVLMPPAQPTPDDDGLLTIDDVLGLRLTSNRWLILSACNTGAPDKSGEGFSGLTRAFFYAGARSLLVSQWSVDDAATDQLMANVFGAYAANRSMPRAEALRKGMQKLMTEDAQGKHAYFAHPFAWAAFMVVGEGGPSVLPGS